MLTWAMTNYDSCYVLMTAYVTVHAAHQWQACGVTSAGKKIIIGVFDNLADAKRACEQWGG